LQLPNWREFLLMRFALAKIGVIAVPLPIDWRRKEVEFVLRETAAVGVLIPETYRGREYLRELEEMLPTCPSLRLVLIARTSSSASPDIVCLDDLLSDPVEEREDRSVLARVRPGPNEVDLVVTTSGSTAAPKLVVRTPNC